MAYIDSSKINIYPSAYRNGFNPESYLNTEYNLTHTKQLSSKIDSFAFEKEESIDGALVDYIYIYLKGYYFKCIKSDILSLFGTVDQTKPIWAQIKINTEDISAGDNVTYTNTKLANLANDSNQILDSGGATSKFQGISFTNAENAPTGGYSLKVLIYDEDWVVPVASQSKLSTTEILDGDAGSQSINKHFTTQSASIASANITSAVVGDISSTGSSSVLSIYHKNLTLAGNISLPANPEGDGKFVYGQNHNSSASPETTPITIKVGTGANAIPIRDASGNFNAETATSATTATNIANGESTAIPYQTNEGTTGFIRINDTPNRMFLTQLDSGTPEFRTITADDLPSVPNAKLANSTITLWGTTLALGGSISNLGRLDKLKTKEFKAFAGTTDDNADANCVAIEWSSSNPSTAIPTLRVKGGNINCNGNIQGATITTTSDARLKENVVSYKSEKSILDLDVKKFDFINGEKNQIGCIAQDLKEICPEIVSEDENGYLSIQESKIVYLLLNEVKKLKEELEKINTK